jgi:TolB-like protein
MGADEVGTLKGLTERRAILDRLIGEHGGRIANTAGDSVLAEFGSAVDAVQCAVDAQAALTEVNSSLPADRHINFRIGIHVGDVMVRARDLFGDGVNIAARLQSIAKPGGVCISGATYDQVRKVLPMTFGDLGLQQVKNIQEPIRAYQVGATSEAREAPARVAEAESPPPLPDKPSIAVLPFQNMSGDPEQEYFADGIVEEIITSLSRIRWLFVIARNSSFTYKGRAIDVKQVGRELGVRYVLEGSVRKAGNRIRITAQLIDAINGAHLWADHFDGLMENVFELQDSVAVSVAGVIEPAVEAAEMLRSAQRPTDDLTAYDLYLRAVSAGQSWEKQEYCVRSICSGWRWNTTRTTALLSRSPPIVTLVFMSMVGSRIRKGMASRVSNMPVGRFEQPRTILLFLGRLPMCWAISSETSVLHLPLWIGHWNSTQASPLVGSGVAGSGRGAGKLTLLSSTSKSPCGSTRVARPGLPSELASLTFSLDVSIKR